MIEMVQTGDGLVPKHVHESMQRTAEAARKKFENSVAGMRPRVLKRVAALVRERLGEEELAKVYPCRNCATIRDERYGEACAALRREPCYMVAHYRGCASWRPLPIIA